MIELAWIEFHTMRIRYFEDTDTLLIELKPGSVAA